MDECEDCKCLIHGRIPSWCARGINTLEEQDKWSDIEQHPPFSDHKYSNILPQKRGGGDKYPQKEQKILVNKTHRSQIVQH